MHVETRPLARGETGLGGRLLNESLLVEPGFAAIVPDPRQRTRVMTPLLTGMLRNAMRYRSAWGGFVSGRLLGAAVWLPPGAYPHSKLENLMLLPSLRGMVHIGRSRVRDMAEFEAAAVRHFPEEPVWYLQAFGVSPEAQGQGIGSRLILPDLMQADTNGQSCYLETGTERNVRFYERFGFEVREAAAQLAPNGPTHWTMIRRPQTATS
jgi:ribosomal protein S18 acetylase RimI-like enzyme